MGVRMHHPASGGDYDAAPEQVPHLQAAGWQEAEGFEGQGEVWPAEAQRFEGQEQVRMRHPDLDAEITVARSTVASHQSNGWYQVETDVALPAEGDVGLPDDLDPLTVGDLQELLRARGLPVTGRKDELVARLRTPPAEEEAEPAGPAGESEA